MWWVVFVGSGSALYQMLEQIVSVSARGRVDRVLRIHGGGRRVEPGR